MKKFYKGKEVVIIHFNDVYSMVRYSGQESAFKVDNDELFDTIEESKLNLKEEEE